MKIKLLERLLLTLFLATGSVVLVEPAKAETITSFRQGENFDIPLRVASRGYYTIDLSSHVGDNADLCQIEIATKNEQEIES